MTHSGNGIGPNQMLPVSLCKIAEAPPLCQFGLSTAIRALV